MITVRRARPAEYERVGTLTVAAYRELPVDHLFGGYDEKILDTARDRPTPMSSSPSPTKATSSAR